MTLRDYFAAAFTFGTERLADMMTSAHSASAALFRTMLTVVAGRAGMAWKRTCARCTESGAGQQNSNEENDGYFHVGIIITPPSVAQGIKSAFTALIPESILPISSGGN